MTDEQEAPDTVDQPTAHRGAISPKIVVLLVVVAVFAGVLTARVLASRPTSGTGSPVAVAPSPTSTRNDAMADYQAAIKTGKPIYVLFHSLS